MPNTPPLNFPFAPSRILSPDQVFAVTVAALVSAYDLCKWIIGTRFGRAVAAVRENEMRAELLGYDSRVLKLATFMLGAAIAGVAGMLFATSVFVSPTVFGLANTAQVGILGHNGMGKTTLLRTLMGHLPATAGQIRFAGQDISRLAPERRARLGIGYVPQGRQIFPALTVLDNLRVGAIHLSSRLASAKIEETVEDFPRLKPILGRVGGVLSGGEQQILALARCLCASPRLILLDEPTEGIQPSIVEEIKDILLALSKRDRLSIMLVEQDLDFISSLADRVLLIRKGQLKEEIDPAVLRDSATAGAFVGLGA